jgi:hypothetical protein
MVPLFWDVLETQEDSSHTTPELRLRHYGQEDHVRIFSKADFVDRLARAGFEVIELGPSYFDEKQLRENAISQNSILYVCTK